MEMVAEEVVVRFDENLHGPAKEIIERYGSIKNDISAIFGWTIDFRPTIVLIKKREEFQKIVGSDLFVAVAIPKHRRIIIDYTKMNTRPFTIDITIKHELCHLLLHDHLTASDLPKWLDEGVCQWVSGGIAEIIRDPNRLVLETAVLSERYIPFKRLSKQFPKDKEALVLAYDQSKSIVAYIDRVFGKDKALDILGFLKAGNDADTAILKSLSISTVELEEKWRRHLEKKATWFSYLAANLYGILFFIGSLITLLGFLRYRMRKRRYPDDDEDDFH